MREDTEIRGEQAPLLNFYATASCTKPNSFNLTKISPPCDVGLTSRSIAAMRPLRPMKNVQRAGRSRSSSITPYARATSPFTSHRIGTAAPVHSANARLTSGGSRLAA
jgi:hypothetical protein